MRYTKVRAEATSGHAPAPGRPASVYIVAPMTKGIVRMREFERNMTVTLEQIKKLAEN